MHTETQCICCNLLVVPHWCTVGHPPECVCFVGVFPRPHLVDFFFLSIFKVSKQRFLKAEMNKIQTLSLRLERPPLTARDFQSSHYHSFIDSSGSASIPSSLIHKLRTAILIALRTVEVFNGFLPDRGKGALSLPRVGLKFPPLKTSCFFFPREMPWKYKDAASAASLRT